MQALAERHGVRLRPHAKSHKCLGLARLQIEAGAQGICVAKVSEGEAFAVGGMEDLLAAFPLVGGKAEAWAALAARNADGRFEVVADSERGLEDLGRAASRNGVTLGVWLKVDVGLHRCGVEPEDPRLELLAKRVRNTPGLRLRGLLTHAGQVYGATPDEVAAIGRAEGEVMVEAAQRLERAGSGPLQVSLGSTPTVFHAAGVEGVDEIHPGVYVFGDRQQAYLGAMQRDEISLSVMATVASRPVPGRWVLDAGSKTFSSDRGAHGRESLVGFGEVLRLSDHRRVSLEGPLPFSESLSAKDGDPAAVITRLSEEHGVIESEKDLGFEPGDRVEIIPNHACAAVNLAKVVYVTEGEGENRRVVGVWPVAARAHVQ
jgi:D-serine deaminase-like pyridoxal phosphate-dependent protein